MLPRTLDIHNLSAVPLRETQDKSWRRVAPYPQSIIAVDGSLVICDGHIDGVRYPEHNNSVHVRDDNMVHVQARSLSPTVVCTYYSYPRTPRFVSSLYYMLYFVCWLTSQLHQISVSLPGPDYITSTYVIAKHQTHHVPPGVRPDEGGPEASSEFLECKWWADPPRVQPELTTRNMLRASLVGPCLIYYY